MKGIHVNWTAPYFARPSAPTQYTLEDFDVLVNVASALYWRKLNGPIELYTDEMGLAYYRQYGLDALYDHIDTQLLTDYAARGCDPLAAPCAGRMYVLNQIEAPYLAMDIDLVFFQKLPSSTWSGDFRFFHWEIPGAGVYRSSETLFVPPGFELDPQWNFDVMIPNIAALYISESIAPLWRNFSARAVDYVERSATAGSPMSVMERAVFADQQMLGMELSRSEYNAGPLLDEIWICSNQAGERPRIGGLPYWVKPVRHKPVDIFFNDQMVRSDQFNFMDVYHSWLDKGYFRSANGQLARERFCQRLLKRLLHDFPEQALRLISIKELTPHFAALCDIEQQDAAKIEA